MIHDTFSDKSVTNHLTAPPTYSWDAEGNYPVHQRWAHNHTSGHEVPGEDSKDSPRSPFSELQSKGSLAYIAELPGGTGAKELDTPEITPKLPHTEFGNDMAKLSSESGVETTCDEPRKSTERR